MRSFKHLSVFILLFTLALTLIGCSAKKDAPNGAFGEMFGGDGGYVGADMESSEPSDGSTGIETPTAPEADGEASEGGAEADKSEPSKEPESYAGLLTAAEWNDNKNFGYYKTLFSLDGENDKKGKFSKYLEQNWGFNVLDRVSVYVEKDSLPVAGAAVECKNSDGAVVFYAKTGADGMAYLFPSFDDGSVSVKSGETSAEAVFGKDNRDISVALEGSTEYKRNKIQIMFVIDITGSMGDEHQYLKEELKDVISRVSASDGRTAIELALLFYRDKTDKETFAYYGFTDVTAEAGLSKMIANLSSHAASGGGDYPEAVDEALDMAVNKGWDEDSTTKLIFHLLDAPAHSEEENKQLYSSAVISAADKGIRICPILASGADELCEYIVRQAAVYTGGSFIFITDHSGIGGGHLDPNLPNAVIEKLNDLLVRVISGYHSGTFADPVPWNAPKQ